MLGRLGTWGVTLSNDLEWSKHIATMTNKANSKFLFLRRNMKGCPEKLKQNVYFSLIRSLMEYGATVWDPYQKYNSTIIGKKIDAHLLENHENLDTQAGFTTGSMI